MLPRGALRQIIDATPVGLWLQDWTGLRNALSQQREAGASDLEAYLRSHPDALHELLTAAATVELNLCGRAMLAIGAEHAPPDSLAAILPPGSQQALVPHILAIVAGASLSDQDIEVYTGAGHLRALRLTLCPVPDEDGAPYVLATLREPTGSQDLLRQVEQLDERLQRVTDEREQFMYAASHDLQEPLRMVASYAQLLDKRYRNRLDSRADKYIAYIVDGAKRMQSLLAGLLQLSRIGDRQILRSTTIQAAPVREHVDLNDVVDQALASLRPLIDACGAEFTRTGLPTVKVYRTQLGQVFTHLFDNSLKFRRPDVPLKVQISAQSMGSHWLITVADNGIGIDKEHSCSIFVIFRRLNKRGEYPGIGMGLPLVKKIVESHNGRIWLEPGAGVGASFCFTLPREEI